MEKVITECGNCHITFPSLELAILHINSNHSKPEACGKCKTTKIFTIEIKGNCNTCPQYNPYVPMTNTGEDPLWGIPLKDDDFLFKNSDTYDPSPSWPTPDCFPYKRENADNNPMVRLPDFQTFSRPSTSRDWENPGRINENNIQAHSNPGYSWVGGNDLPTTPPRTERHVRHPPLPTLPLPPTPYFKIQCELCPKSYTNPNSLREHVKAIHTNTPKLCQLCGMSYKYSSNLSRHTKLRHPVEHERYKWKRGKDTQTK